MDRTPVVSSNVGAVGYDPHTQTLEVAFRPTRAGVIKVWSYAPVSPEAFQDMMVPGESVGRHVNAIKLHPAIVATCLPDEVPANVPEDVPDDVPAEVA
jgi:hypothetical protein